MEGSRDLVYFGDHGVARNLVTLAAWLVVGLLVTAVAWYAERRRARAAAVGAGADTAVPQVQQNRWAEQEQEQEIEESVGV